MRCLWFLLALLICMGPLASRVQAEQAASLVADRIALAADQSLTAEGNVEVFYQGTELRAARILFFPGPTTGCGSKARSR